MSFSTLNIGASSLYSAQRAAEIAAHNVANAGTEGYTKQRLAITTAQPTPGTAGMRGDGMRGTGVTVVSIDRLRDVLADLSYRADAGAAAGTSVRAEVLERAQGVLGTYPDGTPAALDRFFAAWDQLSLTPQDPSARAHVVDAGSQLALALNGAAEQLDRLSQDTGARIRNEVGEVNDLAGHVARLNQSISDAVTSGQSPNDLLDQRDRALDRLSTLAGITVRPGAVAAVDVYVGNSVLVSGVSTRPMVATQNAERWGVAFADGPAVVGGSLGAAARAVSVDIPAFVQQLDDFAATLVERVNGAHRDGYDQDGDAGGDYFWAEGVRAGSIALDPGLSERRIAASAGGAASDGNHALVLAGLRSADPSLGEPSLGDTLRGINSRLGSAAANATRQAKAAASSLSGAEQLRSAANGVNIDEEMVDLVKYQHAYEAAARVISIADGFFDTIINRMGAGR